MEPKDSPAKQIIDHERQEVLQQLEEWLEVPMLILSFLWLTLLIAEFLWGLGLWQERIGTGIWVVFILDFAVKFSLAPRKRAYLRNNWLTIIALAVPALRLFRIAKLIRVLRITRAARGLRLVRFITSLNRGMKALGASMGRRGFGYVMTLTLIVLFSGAAGMYRFENEAPAGGFDSYGTALWWTAMLLASLGTDYWPRTPEGRGLCFLLALYGFAVFGYVTAALASFFVDRDAESHAAPLASAKAIVQLHDEIAALRVEVQRLTNLRDETDTR
jgi:voltage-gated potassium channel